MNKKSTIKYPSLTHRLLSVWFRHMRVYSQNIFSNGLPPFLEPLLFLAGIGLGLGGYITQKIEHLNYIQFLGLALPMTSAMFTASFECTFGTFVRMEFQKVYDGMLASSISAEDLVIGEIMWAGTKGLFFSAAVTSVLIIFGIASFPKCLFIPFVGFTTGIMFGSLAMFITSFVRTINHFNFYFSGVISPMFFFSGVVFPISNLPKFLQPLAEIAPLTHSVRLARSIGADQINENLLTDVLYILTFCIVFTILAVKRLKKRLIT